MFNKLTVRKMSTTAREVIVLSVGGKRFETTRGTLTAMNSNILDHAIYMSATGMYMLDRNPYNFGIILSILRGATSVPSMVDVEALDAELRFYGIETDVHILGRTYPEFASEYDVRLTMSLPIKKLTCSTDLRGEQRMVGLTSFPPPKNSYHCSNAWIVSTLLKCENICEEPAHTLQEKKRMATAMFICDMLSNVKVSPKWRKLYDAQAQKYEEPHKSLYAFLEQFKTDGCTDFGPYHLCESDDDAVELIFDELNKCPEYQKFLEEHPKSPAVMVDFLKSEIELFGTLQKSKPFKDMLKMWRDAQKACIEFRDRPLARNRHANTRQLVFHTTRSISRSKKYAAYKEEHPNTNPVDYFRSLIVEDLKEKIDDRTQHYDGLLARIRRKLEETENSKTQSIADYTEKLEKYVVLDLSYSQTWGEHTAPSWEEMAAAALAAEAEAQDAPAGGSGEVDNGENTAVAAPTLEELVQRVDQEEARLKASETTEGSTITDANGRPVSPRTEKAILEIIDAQEAQLRREVAEEAEGWTTVKPN
jgi:hypothetical protein